MKSAMNIALDILSRRSVTQYEMEKRLQDKKIAPKESAEIILKLIEWGYINDFRLAMDYCQRRSGRHSRLKIRQDLWLRGLDKILVDEVLDNSYTLEQELQLCMKLAQQILDRESQRFAKQTACNKAYNKIPQDIFLQHKVGAKLARLGYPYEMINEVLSNSINEKLVT
ncbi:MAG: regulatory protein RecX [Desulfitobacteriaceae bacterium]